MAETTTADNQCDTKEVEKMPRKPFQFHISTLLGLTAVVAVLVRLGISELPTLALAVLGMMPQLYKVFLGVLIFPFGWHCILVLAAFIRLRRFRALHLVNA